VGGLAKVKIPENKREKIGPKIIDEIFIGYASDNILNRFLIINSEISDIAKNIIVEARGAHYFDNIFPYKTRLNTNVNKDDAAPSSSLTKLLEE